MPKILLVIALESEARKIISKYKLKPFKNTLNVFNNIDESIYLIISGIGKVNCAINVCKYQHLNDFEYIINLGASGAYGNFNQGDDVIVKNAKYHDFDLTLFDYKKGQVPGFPEYFYSNTKLVNLLIQEYPNMRCVKLLTGDFFVTEKVADEDEYVVDMEGAAFFQTLFDSKAKLLSAKVISDVINGHNYEKYSAFEESKIDQYVLDLFEKIYKIL